MNKLNNRPPFLPSEFIAAHYLCYRNHDIMLEMLRSGEKHGVFNAEYPFRDEADRHSFEESEDIFTWLSETKREEERVDLLRRTIFPAVLSDFLHFVYEALACSGKAKLTVAFALLRKPLQENLHLLESIATDFDSFAAKLATEPHRLSAGGSGGLSAHQKRIDIAINQIDETDRFDGEYLAVLRYDKRNKDSFAHVFDTAIHLFTDNHAIRTEPMNINFIFSDNESRWSQWSYIYSRLPYVLTYARLLFEHVLAAVKKTDPKYIEDMERRLSASTLLWSETISEEYIVPPLTKFINATKSRLDSQCESQGYRVPSARDLDQLADTGRMPGETFLSAYTRNMSYGARATAAKAVRQAVGFAQRLGSRKHSDEDADLHGK
ncbi:MAG: hypothetical protein JNM40_17850 [Myxococcales bacterium]|nr:hypothetical protein [Myxococcales bacterium]